MEKKKQFLNIVMAKELLDRIDDFKFSYRYDTRAEAVRYLLEYALDKHNKGEGR